MSTKEHNRPLFSSSVQRDKASCGKRGREEEEAVMTAAAAACILFVFDAISSLSTPKLAAFLKTLV